MLRSIYIDQNKSYTIHDQKCEQKQKLACTETELNSLTLGLKENEILLLCVLRSAIIFCQCGITHFAVFIIVFCFILYNNTITSCSIQNLTNIMSYYQYTYYLNVKLVFK